MPRFQQKVVRHAKETREYGPQAGRKSSMETVPKEAQICPSVDFKSPFIYSRSKRSVDKQQKETRRPMYHQIANISKKKLGIYSSKFHSKHCFSFVSFVLLHQDASGAIGE